MEPATRRGWTAVAVLAALCSLPLPVLGQNAISITAEYDKLLAKRTSVTTLGPDLFGDSVNLNDGALQFRQVDVSLPGNNGLKVEFARTFSPRQWQLLYQLFADWDLDIPHLAGVFAPGGWLTQISPSTARCTNYNAPPATTGSLGSSFLAPEFWAGNFLDLPGQKGVVRFS